MEFGIRIFVSIYVLDTTSIIFIPVHACSQGYINYTLDVPGLAARYYLVVVLVLVLLVHLTYIDIKKKRKKH